MKFIGKKKSAVMIMLLTAIAATLFGVFMLCGFFDNRAAYADTDSTTADKLTFVLHENSTAYKVKARDKTISEIAIPDTYNGLPVTAIADR